jgi:hypothetical protein
MFAENGSGEVSKTNFRLQASGIDHETVSPKANGSENVFQTAVKN